MRESSKWDHLSYGISYLTYLGILLHHIRIRHSLGTHGVGAAQARGRGEALDADLARNAASQAKTTKQPTIEVDDNGKKETETSDDDLGKEKEPESRERSCQEVMGIFFPSGMVDDALRLGPCMRISILQKRSQKR